MSAEDARFVVAAQLEKLTARTGPLFGGGRDTVSSPENYTGGGHPTRARRQLRRQIIDQYLSRQNGVPREGAAALLTAGPPGAGKTTSLDQLGLAVSDWRRLDADESDRTVVVEGNHYFPRESLKAEHFRDSTKHTVCPWKGTASYFDVVVDDQVNPGAAWYYPEPKSAAAEIRGHVAFWQGVTVQI
ncbi:MAG: DUF427 domain-containing protein [Rhodanobacter sp.]